MGDRWIYNVRLELWLDGGPFSLVWEKALTQPEHEELMADIVRPGAQRHPDQIGAETSWIWTWWYGPFEVRTYVEKMRGG